MGLFYYNCENITNSHLAFGQQSDKGCQLDSKARAMLEEVFGCVEGEGAIETRAGKLIAN